jgi:hypothetical protein
MWIIARAPKQSRYWVPAEHFWVGGEVYRLAMREGHATEDFPAIYDYLTTTHQT